MGTQSKTGPRPMNIVKMKFVLVALACVCLLSGAVYGQEEKDDDKKFDIKKLVKLFNTAKKAGFNFDKVNFDNIGAKLKAKGLDFTKLKFQNPELKKDLEEIEQLRLKNQLKKSSSSEDLILPKITTSNTVLPKAQPKKLTKEEEAENLRRFNANLKRVANLKKKSQMKAVLQAPAAAPLASSKPAVSGRVQHVLPGSRQFAPIAFKHSSRVPFVQLRSRNLYRTPVQRLSRPFSIGTVPTFGPQVTPAHGYHHAYFF